MDEINQCILIGNEFANSMQFVVCILAISVLFFHKIFVENDILNIKRRWNKRYKEAPGDKRDWSTWFMDNTKQGLSSAAAHIYATYIARMYTIGNDDDDECGWFLIQFVFDTIFGVFLSFGISKLTIYLLHNTFPKHATNWFTIGNYNTNGVKNKYYVWLVQVFHWVWCSMAARIICTAIIFLSLSFWKQLNMKFSDLWIQNRHNELIFVILGMPTLLNSIQFLLTNWFLHWKRPKLNQYLHTPLLFTTTSNKN